jgi:3-oxoacyl-[acyl-carrier-protein] synthase-3
MEELRALEEHPVLAFEKDLLRWMLSDGAGAVLLENTPRQPLALRVEWVDSLSYANELDVCMYGGGELQADGTFRVFHEFDAETAAKRGMTTLQQDVRLLNENIVTYAVKALAVLSKRRGVHPADADYFLPHLSSLYFRHAFVEELARAGMAVPAEKWFTNLDRVGNVGAASIYLALEELVQSGVLKQGQKIWLAVPESGRFNFAQALVTVC